MSMQRSKFWGHDEKRYWTAIDPEAEVKLVAKMFREITHIKPPRGRTGRQLDFDQHFCVIAANNVYRQEPLTAEQELLLLENREESYRTSYDPSDNGSQDLQRLATWHYKHQNLLATQNVVRGLEDLVQGLMGLGLKNVSYETIGYSEKKYLAKMQLENFIITVKERGADD